jgi:quercetin dioxygenase-like cupin family protein
MEESMIGQKYNEIEAQEIKPGVFRRLAYTGHLMIAVIDFNNGPQEQPDPPHQHVHEQVTYVAEGEIVFFMDDQQVKLGPGDLFTVPSDKPHTIQLLTSHARLIDSFTPIREDFI